MKKPRDDELRGIKVSARGLGLCRRLHLRLSLRVHATTRNKHKRE